jgi:N-acetylglucosamine-6-sulfatase
MVGGGGNMKILCRWLVVAVVAVVPVIAGGAGPASPGNAVAAQLQPNIVFVFVDDGRVDELAVMPRVRQRIASAGASLTDFYAPFPLCCPARATLLTGEYAHNHRVLGNAAPAGGFKKFDDRSTLATWLTPTYRTGMIGKYLNGYTPPYKPPGWDEWQVPTAMYGYYGNRWFLDRGNGGSYQTVTGYQTDTLGALAAEFVTRNAPRAEPFYLQLSIVAPHDGLPREADDVPGFPSPHVEPAYRDAFAGLTNPDPSFNEADVSDKPLRPAPLSATEIRGITEHYQQRHEASLSVDDAVGVLMDALSASGELADTYVIFSSDNGLMLGEHRIRGGKGTPYEVASRVPFLVRGPGIPAGRVVEEVAGQVDFAPTVMQMAGLSVPSSVDGLSLLGLLQGTQQSVARPAVLLEAAAKTSVESPPWVYQGVVDGRWKYVARTNGGRELYDLEADPYELVNVAGRAAYASQQQVLASLLAGLRECAGAQCR